jgi:hypothetical protein
MEAQTPTWKFGISDATGWEVLQIPRRGVFGQDLAGRYYCMTDVMPITWWQITDPEDVVTVRKWFHHAHSEPFKDKT